jgi:ribosomal protein S24E
MGLNIISEKDNKLLGRKEIIAEVEYSGCTPTKENIKKMIVTKMGADEKLIIIKIIKTEYGKPKAKLNLVIYNSDKEMREIERIPEEKKEEATNTEEKKEETPAQEKKGE